MSGENPAEATAGAAQGADEGRRFARRMYPLRISGMVLGAVCIGGGLWEQGAPAWLWALLGANLLGWPHLAYWQASRSRDPRHAEVLNLTLDSVFGGIWMALIHFSLAPSVIMFAMLAMDKAAVGGLKFMARCVAAQAAAALAIAFVFQIELQLLQSGMVARIAAAPLLICYPILIGLATHSLARRVRQQNIELAALSSTDGLTRLPNHTAWLEAVEREFARSRREGHESAVLMLDLDHFKAINDRYGHGVGDEVLRGVAEVLREALRTHDVPGRYGGEEFGVLLSGSSAVAAEAIAERIRKKIEWASFAGEARVTTSIGCAALEPSDPHPAAWVARADRALYAAKAAGRNRAMRDLLKSA